MSKHVTLIIYIVEKCRNIEWTFLFVTREVGVCACPGVDVGHCQGRMFNIKSGAGTLKWSGPPRTPLIPSPAVAIVALVIYYLEASPAHERLQSSVPTHLYMYRTSSAPEYGIDTIMNLMKHGFRNVRDPENSWRDSITDTLTYWIEWRNSHQITADRCKT